MRSRNAATSLWHQFSYLRTWCTDVKNIREIDILWWLPELHTSKIGQTIWSICQLSCLSATLQSKCYIFISFILLKYPPFSKNNNNNFNVCMKFCWNPTILNIICGLMAWLSHCPKAPVSSTSPYPKGKKIDQGVYIFASEWGFRKHLTQLWFFFVAMMSERKSSQRQSMQV